MQCPLVRDDKKHCFCHHGRCKEGTRFECHEDECCQKLDKCKGGKCACSGDLVLILDVDVDFSQFMVQMEIRVTKSLRKVANKDGRNGMEGYLYAK